MLPYRPSLRVRTTLSFWRRLLGVAVAAAGVSSATAQTNEPITLTLTDAIGLVEHANLNVLLSREAVLQAIEQSHAVRANLLPIITASAQQRRAKTAAVTNTVTTSGPYSRFDGQLSGSYAVVDPVRQSVLQSANLSIEILRADYAATLQLVIASIAERYFTHLRNLRRLDVLDANIARARSLLVLAQNQLRAGTATQIDVTRAEAQLAQAEQARLQQETVDYQSEMALKRALDIDPARPLRLQELKVRRDDLPVPGLVDVAPALGVRADYQRAQKTVEQARLDLRTARFERMPTLTLNAQYGDVAPNLNRGTRKETWFAGAIVNVSIFDGLRATADRELAASRQRSQELRLRNLEKQISAELRLALQDARSRSAQMVMAEKNLRLADDQLRLAQQRYQQGVADNREIVEAQTQLAVAEDSTVEAGYQYNLSRLELARSRGEVRSILQETTP